MESLAWIDEYVARLREFIFVREEDGLLIKVPNEAYKLNAAAVKVLHRLLDGETVTNLWQSYGATPEIKKDLNNFFIGLKLVLEKRIDEQKLPPGIVAKPFQLGFSTLPVLSEVALTYRCNLKCRFCYATCHGEKDESLDKAGFEEVLRIIRHEAKVPSVSFTGGEPTLFDALPELVHYTRHTLGMRVNLITNGTLIDQPLANALKEAGLHSAQVSVESPEPSVHDKLTGQPGSHRRTLQGLQRLRDLGIAVHSNTTINRMNVETLLQMPEWVKKQGLNRFSMNLVIPMRKDDALNMRYSEVAAWVPRVLAESRKQRVEFMWYSPTPVCMFNPIQYQLGNKGCAACDGLLSISPSGDVLPCSSWPEPVGNMLRQGFSETWQSVRASKLRAKQEAPQSCTGCDDFNLCQGACPLYWHHFGTDELQTRRRHYAVASR